MAPSSDDSETEDDLVALGTPLPEIDETEVPKKPTTIQDLTAKDKEGRRRFHGAFTGGYSAGYFNTVGSKEGFTPSTFVSSRKQKQEDNDAQSARPEDFMDDEDLDEHGIAPRKFATAGNYTSEERKRKFDRIASQLTQSSALDLGSALTDLVVPEYLPIGIKLLRKMGWREGQGLGPRVRKMKKKRGRKRPNKGASDGKKTYGCAMPPSESESEDSDSFIPANVSELTFAPSDITPIALQAKDDVKGLGYRGLDPSLALPGSHINLFGNPVRGKNKAGKGIRGHAFGVGALEDDDDDIYAQDSLSNYDVTMKDGDDNDQGQGGNFGWTAPRVHGKQKLPVSYVGKLLEGFCLSSKPLQPRKTFPPPRLPPNFKPRHWSRRRKIEEDSNSGQNKMTAIDRGLMLGEMPIMSSVFDLVGSKDKNRIECAKEAIEMTRSLDDTKGSSSESVRNGNKKGEDEVAKLSGSEKKTEKPKFLSRFVEATSTTESNSSGDKDYTASVNKDKGTSLFKGSMSLQPFRKDPAKQARFDQYMAALQQKAPDPYNQVSRQSGGGGGAMTEWEKARERDEFSRSARLFRPMSAMMSSRFVVGPMLDDKDQDSKTETGDEVTDQVKASEMRMFGKLTRDEFEWHPDKLLCKRFNVPNPYPGSDIVGLPNVKRDKYSVFNFLSFGDYQPKETDSHTVSTAIDVSEKSQSSSHKVEHPDKPAKKKATLSSIFKVLDDPDFHKPPTNSKSEELPATKLDGGNEERDENDEEEPEADVDLFRAIFKNSDSEDSEDDRKSDMKEEDGDESMSGDEEKHMKKDNGDGDDDKHSVIPASLSKGVFNETANESGSGGPSPNSSLSIPGAMGDAPNASVRSNAVPSDSASSIRPARTRWDAGSVPTTTTKSVFSVLDEINNEQPPIPTAPAADWKPTEIKEEISDSEYGPVLPPPPPTMESTPDVPFLTGGGSLFVKQKDVKVREKDTTRHRHRDKHKHKKDKKKKSKHKTKKEKKKPKKSRKSSSKSRKSRPDSSGSETDWETTNDDDDSDISDKELLNRFIQVSKMKSGKS